ISPALFRMNTMIDLRNAHELVGDFQRKWCSVFATMQELRRVALAAKQADRAWQADNDPAVVARVWTLAGKAEDCVRAYERLRLLFDVAELDGPPLWMTSGEVYDRRKYDPTTDSPRIRYFPLDEHRLLTTH